jgi:vacuolar-type H+-ATPase subunit E/Vma4
MNNKNKMIKKIKRKKKKKVEKIKRKLKKKNNYWKNNNY